MHNRLRQLYSLAKYMQIKDHSEIQFQAHWMENQEVWQRQMLSRMGFQQTLSCAARGKVKLSNGWKNCFTHSSKVRCVPMIPSSPSAESSQRRKAHGRCTVSLWLCNIATRAGLISEFLWPEGWAGLRRSSASVSLTGQVSARAGLSSEASVM